MAQPSPAGIAAAAAATLQGTRAVLNPALTNPRRRPPSGGNYEPDMQQVLDYLQHLIAGATFANQHRFITNQPQIYICPVPVRFRETQSRRRYCAKNWRDYNYPDQQSMERAYLTIDEALGRVQAGRDNYFVFLMNWNRIWKQTFANWLFNNRNTQVLPGQTVQQINQWNQQDRIQLMEDHADEHEEPHAIVLKIRSNGSVDYYDPNYNDTRSRGRTLPVAVAPGGSARQMRHIWFAGAGPHEFLRGLNDRTPILPLGRSIGPNHMTTLYGRFIGEQISCCLSFIRDEIWDDLGPATPIQPGQRIYPDNQVVHPLNIL